MTQLTEEETRSLLPKAARTTGQRRMRAVCQYKAGTEATDKTKNGSTCGGITACFE